MTLPAVAVIIPFFQAPAALKRCMDSLQAGSYANLTFFVRDNSVDNVFYTKAVNEGLAKYLCDPDVGYALVLNQDAFAFPDMVRALVDYMEANPTCGIACPLQIREDGVTVSWGGSWEAFPRGRHRCDPLEVYTAPFDTFWANGGAMLIRMATLRQIGLLDENMRFVCSDADLSFTARARGWKVAVVPAARVEHSFSSSAHAEADELNRVKIQDVLYFTKKWLSGDLYRGLAFEGPRLTEATIKAQIDKAEAALRIYQQSGAGPAPG